MNMLFVADTSDQVLWNVLMTGIEERAIMVMLALLLTVISKDSVLFVTDSNLF